MQLSQLQIRPAPLRLVAPISTMPIVSHSGCHSLLQERRQSHAAAASSRHTAERGDASSQPAAQPDFSRRRQQQQTPAHSLRSSSSSSSSSSGSQACLTAAALVALAAGWAPHAHAGVLSDFLESRTTLTTSLASVAFILLVILTAGVRACLVKAAVQCQLRQTLTLVCAVGNLPVHDVLGRQDSREQGPQR